MATEGYLDIETNSLSLSEGEITVIGIGIEKDGNFSFFQLTGEEITAERLIRLIKRSRIKIKDREEDKGYHRIHCFKIMGKI